MWGARRREGEGGPRRGRGIDVAVGLADAMDLARRRRTVERYDRVIPNAAVKDVSEHDDRTAWARERQPEAATFAGIILCQPGFGIARAAIVRRRKEQTGAVVFLTRLLRRNPVALVQPSCDHRSVRIQP